MTATAITIVGSFRDPTRRIERALSVRLGPLTTEGRMAAPAGHTAIMSSILAPSCTARPSAASRSSTGEIDRLRVRLGIPRVGVLVRAEQGHDRAFAMDVVPTLDNALPGDPKSFSYNWAASSMFETGTITQKTA